jgi:TRAP transporter TAXI family solute receptor
MACILYEYLARIRRGPRALVNVPIAKPQAHGVHIEQHETVPRWQRAELAVGGKQFMAIRIGTSEHGGTFYTQGAAFAELFNCGRCDADVCVVQTTDASIHNAEKLDRSELEFGFMASNWIGRALNAEAPFTRKIELRMVAPANAGPMFFVTLAGSPIRTVADFRGKRIAIGPKGSGMEQHCRVIFGVLDLPFDSFTPVHASFAEGAEALIDGQIDGQFQPPIPNSVMTDLSERGEVRIVPYAAGQLERVLGKVPYYRSITMEKGIFRGVTKDTAQLAVVNVLVTHKNVSELTVHDMARTIADNLDRLPQMNPLFKGLKTLFEPLRTQGARAFEFGGVALHPGAVQAYRAMGWIA